MKLLGDTLILLDLIQSKLGGVALDFRLPEF